MTASQSPEKSNLDKSSAERAGARWDEARNDTFAGPNRERQNGVVVDKRQLSDEEARNEFQGRMTELIEEATSIGPVKRKQGYYQVLKEKHKDWSDEKASKEAHRIKKFNESKDVLRVNDMLPTESAERRKQMLQSVMKTYDEEIAKVKAAAALKEAEEKKVSDQRAAEQKAAEEKVAEQKAAEQKAAEQKAAEQKAAEDKAAEQKAAEEKAAAEKKNPPLAETLESLRVRREGFAGPMPSDQENPSDKKPSQSANSNAEKDCGTMKELGNDIAGGALLGGTAGFVFGEGVGAIPGALIGGIGGAVIWYKDKEKCEAEKAEAVKPKDK